MLDNPIRRYELNLQSARDLETIYVALSAMTTSAVPKDELLRAELVSIVSALDTYVHDIVREGLLCSYRKGIHNTYIGWFAGKHTITSLAGFESKLREMHGYKTFQAPQRIADAVGMLGISDVWSRAAGIASDDETALALIVDRRNKIAHESDINPVNGLGGKWPISIGMVRSVVGRVDNIVRSFDIFIRDELRTKGVVC